MAPEGLTLNYTAVVIAAMVGVIAIGVMFAASYVLSPKKRSELKEMPYECGIPPAAPYSWSQLHMRYYIFAILFLVFDVEAVFLFPWALVFLTSVKAVFYEMLIFIGILFFGILYGWKKGALEWK
ncbi:MAG: NADH-quinone oxidoreductase subunit [Dehalococcoidia bacterium]|nr:NADH-quinone oxidoreductase subunit [Dehalococcoidia bacterium]